MREICFLCERDNRRIQKDPQTSKTHPDASSLDKEDGWEVAYLLHVTLLTEVWDLKGGHHT